MFYIKIQR